MGDRVAAYLPVLVESFDRITQCLSRGNKCDVDIRCGIWRQRRDYLLISIDLIAVFAIGAIIPGKVHGHGAAANNKFAGVIVS